MASAVASAGYARDPRSPPDPMARCAPQAGERQLGCFEVLRGDLPVNFTRLLESRQHEADGGISIPDCIDWIWIIPSAFY